MSLAIVGENSCNNPKFRRRRRNADGSPPKGDEKFEKCERGTGEYINCPTKPSVPPT